MLSPALSAIDRRPPALAHREDAGDRIVHELEGELRARRRVGPDAADLSALAQAMDDVVDGLDILARAWARHPIAELAPPVLAPGMQHQQRLPRSPRWRPTHLASPRGSNAAASAGWAPAELRATDASGCS
jgi:hypothetical protein